MKSEIRKYVLMFLCVSVFSGAVSGSVITDDVGRKVNVKKPVKSIVSLSPGHTEMIYYLGAQDKLKAVSLNCDYPPQAKEKEKAGDFLHPDTEKIASLRPDIVFSGGGIQKKAIAAMEKLGINVIVFYPGSLKDIAGNMSMIADITGCGKNKADEFSEKIKNLEKRAGTKKVYMEISGKPAMAVGGASVINEILYYAGGVNIFDGLKTEYPKISKEEVLMRKPEFIFFFYEPSEHNRSSAYIKNTPAGKEGRFFIFKGRALDSVLRPGPGVLDAIDEIAGIFSGGSR